MLRKIIRIDETLCDGCGICAQACHEGAIGIVDGKARLLREDYCDGLGDCLPACPTGAISFEEREALAYDEAAVKKAREDAMSGTVLSGCPGARERSIRREDDAPAGETSCVESQLSQWPVQIKLVAPNAAWLQGAELLVAADCTAFAYGNFHNEFIRGRITLIGCPKLDAVDYTERLSAMLAGSDVRSITVARMEVPCCGGIENAVKQAIANSGKSIPCRVATISIDGKLL